MEFQSPFSMISFRKALHIFALTRFLSTAMHREAGLLSCQKNAYVKEGLSRVLACDPIVGSSPPAYKVLLDDSVLYPEGGGQPYDLGLVQGLKVQKVTKPIDLTSIQSKLITVFPDITSTNLESFVEVDVEGPVDVGSTVSCTVDWDRRYDFMQQHTAQHLFSAVADKLYQADTVGWALGVDSVTVDLTTSSSLLTADHLQAIEDEVNSMIRQALPVTWQVLDRDELQTLSDRGILRGGIKGAAKELDFLRIVTIGSDSSLILDANPCGGTHLQSLAEINVLKIIGSEKDRKSQRIRFVSGQRALSLFQSCITREAILSPKLSAPAVDHVKAIDKLIKDKKDLEKKLDLANEELASFFGQNLHQSTLSSSVVGLLAASRVGADLKFLLKASSVALECHPVDCKIVFIISAEAGDGCFVIASSASHQAVLQEVKNEVLQLLGGKGGGRPGLLQGTATRCEGFMNVIELLRTKLV